MKTPLCETLGCDVPIVAFTHCRDVVAAVTKAGGFGVLGAAGHTPEQLDIDMGWIVDEVGGRPFGVDIIVPAKYEGKTEGELSVKDLKAMIPPQHRQFLDDMMERYDVPPLPARRPARRNRWRLRAADDLCAGRPAHGRGLLVPDPAGSERARPAASRHDPAGARQRRAGGSASRQEGPR